MLGNFLNGVDPALAQQGHGQKLALVMSIGQECAEKRFQALGVHDGG